MSNWEYTETELWRYGQGGISIFHVFGVTAHQHTVLTFAEARYGNGGDADSLHDIWMRRSTDSGHSFEDSICLLAAEDVHCWTNPVPVWDTETGRVFLFVSDNRANKRTENFLLYSDDAGVTWSAPQSINPILDNSENPPAFHLAGPGHGIQLTHGAWAGRLVVQFWHRHQGTDVPLEQRGYCISVLYSDDHGATWQHTPYIYHDTLVNESRIVETQTGLLWNIRTRYPERRECHSTDGGATWGELTVCPIPPVTVCDAGATSLAGKPGYENTLLVSHVSATPPKRRDMEICISTDGGVTFDDVFTLPTGDAMPGYSDLCVLYEDEPVVGLVHCRNNHVLFSRISMQTLTGGKYENTTRHVLLDGN